jgi:Mn2+/Fe2+ NRAMP family transporter
VLVVGSALGGGLEFERLASVLVDRLGPGAEISLAVGLFGAGLTSAITAPLAGAITARTLLGDAGSDRWNDNSWRYRGVWIAVLVVGVTLGATGVKPIPVIILAQAFNGLVLPLIAVFLWLTMNDRDLLGSGGVNSLTQNLVMGAVVIVCVMLGLRGLLAAATKALALIG